MNTGIMKELANFFGKKWGLRCLGFRAMIKCSLENGVYYELALTTNSGGEIIGRGESFDEAFDNLIKQAGQNKTLIFKDNRPS